MKRLCALLDAAFALAAFIGLCGSENPDGSVNPVGLGCLVAAPPPVRNHKDNSKPQG